MEGSSCGLGFSMETLSSTSLAWMDGLCPCISFFSFDHANLIVFLYCVQLLLSSALCFGVCVASFLFISLFLFEGACTCASLYKFHGIVFPLWIGCLLNLFFPLSSLVEFCIRIYYICIYITIPSTGAELQIESIFIVYIPQF
jgi:hypothetical protein